MLIDGVNEVRLKAFEIALDIMRDEASGVHYIENPNDKTDIFTLADKIYNYITNIA